jgi:ribosomal protein S18 acetylase RimI-like enzyme
MALTLTSALLDQILFAMEDQEGFSVLNVATRQVEPCFDESSCADGLVLPLPTWSSTDGFHMMREFSESLSHPEVQAELRAALDSGQGVFRRFKQILKPRELLYRQWLRFKRKFMEEKVRQWMAAWPDVITENPAEPAFDLEERTPLATDFALREGTRELAGALEEWDALACQEAASVVFGDSAGDEYAEYFRRGRRYQKGDRFWVSENPQGEWAGMIWVRRWEQTVDPIEVWEVLSWYVDPEYRGLGLGSMLLQTLRTSLGPKPTLTITVPLGDTKLDSPLVRLGFVAAGRLWFSQGD